MLYVNTIEFGGRKAVINSYSPQFINELRANMDRQREAFAARFPKATVQTERMTDADTIKLVALHRDNHNIAWEIGRASEGEGSSMDTTETIVSVEGEQLDLTQPRDADRFLVYFRGSYRAAEQCGWQNEFLLAQRVVSQAIYDQSHPASEEDEFEAWADSATDADRDDH